MEDVFILKKPVFDLESNPLYKQQEAYQEGFLNGLTLKRQNKKQRKLVPKIPLESQLKIKYMDLLSRPLNEEEFNKMVEDFKNDVEIVKKKNPMYREFNL